MSMIPQVKCRRCGASFSALRSSCPNCGTRRVTQSGRTPGATPGTVKGTASYERAETNTKWQMIFGLILVVAVILAVIVMVTTSLKSPNGIPGAKETPPPVNEIVPPPIEAPPTTPPPPPPTIEKIVILFGTQVKNEGPETWPMQKVGEEIKYTAQAFPIGLTGLEFTWSCDDPEIFELTPEENGTYCTVKCLKHKPGGAMIKVECFGKETEYRIYTTEG